jgi:hypothetical protein
LPLEKTASRLWKRLGREERLAAAAAFFADPPPEGLGAALGAIVKARRLRPQVARSLPVEEQARALASILDPGETVCASLLVALHLGERREMLGRFLDALGLPHEDGVLKEEAAEPAPIPPDAVRGAVAALDAAYPRHQVETYLNTLWLQDPERWEALGSSEDWLSASDEPQG